jgi:hypothetical protein
MPWWDCGFDIVYAATRQAAARIGRVPREAVRGPYATVEAVRKARALRDTAARHRLAHNDDSGR